MTRADIISKIENTKIWDLVVIGGGASGLGVALDAASRNMSVLLVEKYDFGKGTSSRSTKLVHGGVRYLQQGNIALVREALKERAYILEKAPHNAHLQPFVIPFYSIWIGLYYYIGLKMYDLLSGRHRIGKTTWYNKAKTLAKLPNIKKDGLRGGILYYDGQFDDARLCIDLVHTIHSKGGVCINYCGAEGFVKEKNTIKGVLIKDQENHKEYTVYGKAIVNATGIYTNDIVKKDNPDNRKVIIPSRGSHIVLDKSFSDTDHAIMIPKTSDGRVLFVIPWLQHLIIGTTDVKTPEAVLEPEITTEEINFILDNARQYLRKKPKQSDIKAVYAGLRPLAAPKEEGQSTKEISRGHQILVSDSGLYTLIGGKWTTFRKMGEDVLDKIIQAKRLPGKNSTSEQISIIRPSISLTKNGSADYIIDKATITYYVEKEYAIKVEDILARRTRMLFLDAKNTASTVEKIAEEMQKVMGKSEEWKKTEIQQCKLLIDHYFPPLIK